MKPRYQRLKKLPLKVATNKILVVPKGVNSALQLCGEDILNFLLSLPKISRPVIAKWFRQNPTITQKADTSPVTMADKQVELVLSDAIR